MKAEEESKRKQAKTQLIYTIIGVVAIVFLNTISFEIIKVLIDMAK
jgi:hypothetical protein